MTTVTENLDRPTGVDPAGALATVRLVGANGVALKEARDTAAGKTIVGKHVTKLDGIDSGSPAVGTWSLPLVANSLISPSGTRWARTLAGPGLDATTSYADVPSTGGPYEWKLIETDPPATIAPSGLAAHAADTHLHGGGQRLFVANVGANITTNSTSFIDVPGATGTFTVPPGPFVIKGQFPITIEEANRGAEVRIMAGTTMIAWTFAGPFPVAGSTFTCQFEAEIPSLTWAPVAGTVVTVRATMRTTLASSDASIIVDFAGPFNIAQLWGHTLGAAA